MRQSKLDEKIYDGGLYGSARNTPVTTGGHGHHITALCIRRTRTRTLCIRRTLCRHVTIGSCYTNRHFCCFDCLFTVFDCSWRLVHCWFTVGTVLVELWRLVHQWKFVNSLSPKWPHWTLLLTDFLWSSSAPLISKLFNLARNFLALNYLALCCPNA